MSGLKGDFNLVPRVGGLGSGGGGGTVTDVTATDPVTSTGGNTPNIALTIASTLVVAGAALAVNPNLAITTLSTGVTPSSTGAIRLSNNESISWRNAGDTADVRGIKVDSSDNIVLGEDTNAGGMEFRVATGGRYDYYENGAIGRTDLLPATGAASMTFAAGCTSVSIGQSQHASAAGNPMSVRAQRGFTGFVGGTLTLGGGAGGTLGTNLAGAVRVDLGTQVASVSSKFELFDNITPGAGGFFRIDANVGTARLGSQANLEINSGGDFALAAGGGLRMFFTAPNTAQTFVWRGAGNVTVRTDAFTANGTCVETWAASVTSVTFNQAQSTTGVGAAWSSRAQKGLAGSVGGSYTIGGGDGGTPGTQLAGGTNIELGALVGGVSAKCTFTVATADSGSIQAITNGLRINSGSAFNLEMVASGGANYIEFHGGNQIRLRTPLTVLQVSSQNEVARFEHILAGSFFTMAVGTPWVFRQTQRATDAACNNFTIQTQAPLAGATGANRTPGALILSVPAAVGGGTEAKLQLGLGGVTGTYFWKNATGFGQVWEANTTITMADTAGGVNGYGLVMVAGSPAAVGNRAIGGDISISGGDARGNASTGAKGGGVSLFGGVGSTNDGPGGDIQIVSGNGGASTNTDSGTLILGTGTPQGSGVNGEIQFWQGGTGGGVSVKVGYFAAAGQLHVGADADTTNVNLRINGATQTTVGAAGGASGLPATPTGYAKININGTDQVVPYYAAA